VADFCDHVVSGFDALVVPLHDDEDEANGYIQVNSRLGSVLRYPLLSVSIGVASNHLRPLTSVAQAITIAAEMRLFAKTTAGSCWKLDRRTA